MLSFPFSGADYYWPFYRGIYDRHDVQLTQTVAPTAYLVTLDQLKAELVIAGPDDDTRLNDLLDDLRDGIEAETNLCLTPQTWLQTQSSWDFCIPLRKRPVQSVTVTYYDTNDAVQSLASSNYQLVTYPQSKVVFNNSGSDLPSLYDRLDAVRVTMVCGYSTVPPRARRLCLQMAADLNENREAQTDKPLSPNPAYMRALSLLRNEIIA